MNKELYHLQNCRRFCLDSQDIKYFIRLIEAELKNPREEQMLNYSFAVLWLHGEQTLLLQEIEEFTNGTRRIGPQARGTKEGNKNVQKAAGGSG